MNINSPRAGRGNGMPVLQPWLSQARSVASLLGFSAFSFLFFLGASVEAVFRMPVITIECAMEWNDFVQAGMGTSMGTPGRPAMTDAFNQEMSAQHTATLATSIEMNERTAETDMPGTADATVSNALWADDMNTAMDGTTDFEIVDPFSVDLGLASFASSLHRMHANPVRTDKADGPDDPDGPGGLDIPPSDSTNRAKFLPPRPRPLSMARPFPSRLSPLYLQPTRGIQRIVTVDPESGMVLIREVINGKDVRIPYRMTLEDYIAARYEYERERRTAEKASEYAFEEVDPLENLMRNITEIDIPVAPNPLMSIFGDRSRISVRINGAIDINAGFRIESSDQESVFLRPTMFSPNFRQQVQINVNGLVGDKLSIRADWSTERTFDYENQLKIKYTGYEDEIIQSVEAGNVSLQTPTSLIQGSGALFGLKAEFQLGPLRMQTIASQKKGESARLAINGGAQEQTFERQAFEYSDNHYFIDQAYRDVDQASGESPYEAYYNYRALFPNSNSPVVVRPDLYIKEIEVWISRPA
ncbi:MAG: cell surface protein SprA, partial [Bacteroidetes bacterium]|nr:cell surface protein SprA [Bacteroidota bacterium]